MTGMTASASWALSSAQVPIRVDACEVVRRLGTLAARVQLGWTIGYLRGSHKGDRLLAISKLCQHGRSAALCLRLGWLAAEFPVFHAGH